VSVSGGKLSVSSKFRDSNTYNTSSYGVYLSDNTGAMENTGGIMEVDVVSGESQTHLGNVTASNWTLGSEIKILAGDSSLDAYVRSMDDYINLTEEPVYLKVFAYSEPAVSNVMIKTDGGNYQSIYEGSSTTASGIGWTYDSSSSTLMLSDLTKTYTITGTDSSLIVATDKSSYGMADITIDGLNAAQLKLMGKSLKSYTDPMEQSNAKLYVLGDNSFKNNSSSLTGSAIYVENFVKTTIAGEGTLTAVNSNTSGYAVGIYSSNVPFFEHSVSVSLEGATTSLYGGKSAVGTDQWYGDMSSRTTLISVPYDLFNNVMKAEAGTSPNESYALTSLSFASSSSDCYEHKYLKIYQVYTAPTVIPSQATYDINGDAEKTFDVTYPKLGTTFYKMSSVAIDGTMITGSTSDVGVYASSGPPRSSSAISTLFSAMDRPFS
jgi:predicted outer membrane repeat protein